MFAGVYKHQTHDTLFSVFCSLKVLEWWVSREVLARASCIVGCLIRSLVLFTLNLFSKSHGAECESASQVDLNLRWIFMFLSERLPRCVEWFAALLRRLLQKQAKVHHTCDQ
jgi:hypothetical protein